MMPTDTPHAQYAQCPNHGITMARCPTPSADGQLIYAICLCERRLAIPLAAWQAHEEDASRRNAAVMYGEG